MLQNKIFYSVLTLMLSVMLAINPVRAGSNALNKALGIAGGIIGGRQILKELKRHGPSEGGPSQSRGERNRGGNSQDDDDDNSDERIEIQKSLAALGYDVGEPDGVFGEKTRAAIRAY